MTLPVAENVSPTGVEMGVLSRLPMNSGGHHVETRLALKELEEKSRPAAEWWKAHLDVLLTPTLIFSPDVCAFDPR